MTVLLIGTLDTKGAEVGFVRDRLQESGVPTLVMDVGILGPPTIPADISRERVFSAAGVSLSELQAERDRGRAVSAAAEGARTIAAQLHAERAITGVFGLGGSGGTIIATSAMRALPIGVPRIMVSTLASGQTRPYVGERDIVLWPSVVDVAGINRISRTVLTNAALAMAGMVTLPRPAPVPDRPIITATMFGVTTPCVEQARKPLEEQGNEVLVFHATGAGGRTMEALIADGLVSGVLDITTTELADELAGGVLSAGPERLTAAGKLGVPQVISVGALDMVNFGPMQSGGLPEGAAESYRGRNFYQHNAAVTLMRTTPDENARFGEEIGRKATAAKGPTAILLPLRGVSAIDAPGQPFHDPEADAVLFQAIRLHCNHNVDLIELDLHINDPEFAAAAAGKLLELLQSSETSPAAG
ncbi:MAG: Tm-1-like ATP-binding domain-containing protein [Planctomyces sp.]|nr:Tm-1-like ATP-binding domain-containing protein [Planctomyces sp.]